MAGRVAAVVIALLAWPAAAAADDFSTLYKDYRDDGRIEACKYSEGDLRDAQDEVPPDIEQYAPSFVDELQAAREKRSRGECERTKAATPAAPPAAAAQPPAVPPPSGGAPATAPGPPAQAPAPPAAPAPTPKAPVREVVAGVAPPAVDVAAASEENGVDAGGVLPWAGLALLLMALALAFTRFLGWSPGRRLRPLGASAADAGNRGADWAAEFWDWLRLGR